jgi:transglutaminase-like putative cysteine protease
LRIRIGYEIGFNCVQETPMVLMLKVHPSRQGDLERPDDIITTPSVPTVQYRDSFDNIGSRVIVPPGPISFTTDTVVWDSGETDPVAFDAAHHPVKDLPPETMIYLLGSRYCDTDRLADLAWSKFGQAPATNLPNGWQLVQSICDFVHGHLTFNYQAASSTRTAHDALVERTGVCRDFTHLAVTLCRCMNIPARYCTGYLGDIGVRADPAPMDFSAWFEAYIGGAWYTFDARHNQRRIGRILIARGRDAADVAISTAFGPSSLQKFHIWTEQVAEHEAATLRRSA